MNYRRIPVLLVKDKELYKSIGFRKSIYLGDPVNAVRIFNEKAVDEIIVLDTHRSSGKLLENLSYIREIASESFIPLCYGGGISTLDEINTIIQIGIEKVCIGHQALAQKDFIRKASNRFGKSTILVTIDYKKDWLGKWHVYSQNGRTKWPKDPVAFAKEMEEAGAGELILQSIAHDGRMKGYEVEISHRIREEVSIPLVVLGGAGKVEDFQSAEQAGMSPAAGSFFVFKGKLKAVLINYPFSPVIPQHLLSL